ncbi:hypothetical protein R1flu_021709 [Riccia fluitans]|uniref:Uncharacterized protein n=1 Tax=Riccia fluitans TaxID=41844 RepID=A0ABD1ZQ59_9MARC
MGAPWWEWALEESRLKPVAHQEISIKNKLDHLKKKFKQEKAKQNTTGEGAHEWEFYNIMFDLFGTSSKIIGIPNGADNGQASAQNHVAQEVVLHNK